MKILVYGAGAIGGYLGAILTSAGEDVTLVARGSQYTALAEHGLILEGPKRGVQAPVKVKVCQPGEEHAPYDLIFVTLKSHQINAAAAHLKTLIAKNGTFVFPQNGIPWWYFDGIDSPYRGTSLKTLDPVGFLAKTFDPAMIIGGTALKPANLIAPGRISLPDAPTDALILGELNHQVSTRLERIAAITSRAGWPGVISTDIRRVKWVKLLSNAVWNNLGAITQSTAREAAEYPGSRVLAVAMAKEVIALAGAVGVILTEDAHVLVDQAAMRASLPTSTLQDVRAGRSLEVDALTNALIEIGTLTGVALPALTTVGACVNLLNQRIIQDRVAIRTIAIA